MYYNCYSNEMETLHTNHFIVIINRFKFHFENFWIKQIICHSMKYRNIIIHKWDIFYISVISRNLLLKCYKYADDISNGQCVWFCMDDVHTFKIRRDRWQSLKGNFKLWCEKLKVKPNCTNVRIQFSHRSRLTASFLDRLSGSFARNWYLVHGRADI
jgi:hypothetical protein